MLKAMLQGLLSREARRAPPAPSVADVLHHLEAQRLPEAESAAREVCRVQPGACEPRHLLGHILSRRGDLTGAIGILAEAAALEGAGAEVYYSLASAHVTAGGYKDAIEEFRRAIEKAPQWAAAWVRLADCYVTLDRTDAAEDAYARAIELEPGLAEAHYNFGNLLLRLGRVDEAVKSYERALALKPDFRAAHTNLVYTLNFVDGMPPAELYRAHLHWAQRHAEPLTAQAVPHAVRSRSRRPLRIGYVSPNFRRHAATYFFEPVLRHHDRVQFAIYCYADVKTPDARTTRLQRYESVWRDIAGRSDADAAAVVAADEIDILVDLTGYTENDRLLLFAWKPAPLQITWNGYANTTGMSAIDYRITDAYCDPRGTTEHLHRERLLRMPRIYMPFEPPEDEVELTPPPCLARGHVTFGSFNALSKINTRAVRLWSGILAAVPSARLLVLTVPEGRARARLCEAFEAAGVDRARLEFRGRLPERAFLEAHRDADIALDTFPFHGTTTTAHTLWMGLPVITLAGAAHASRVGVSMLSNVGLQDLVAADEEAYVARAVALANDAARLQTLRATLRERMHAAPNMDGAGFTRELERAYLQAWEERC